MLHSIWTQRVVAICGALAFGFIVDQLVAYPYWSAAAVIAGVVAGMVLLNRSYILGPLLKLDRESVAVVRLAVLTLLFFAECILLAWLIGSAGYR